MNGDVYLYACNIPYPERPRQVGACNVQGVSCKTFPAFVIQGTVGDNVHLCYLQALPAVLSASCWFVRKLQDCVAGTAVVQLCVLC